MQMLVQLQDWTLEIYRETARNFILSIQHKKSHVDCFKTSVAKES